MLLEGIQQSNGAYDIRSSFPFWGVGYSVSEDGTKTAYIMADGFPICTRANRDDSGEIIGGWLEIGVTGPVPGFAINTDDGQGGKITISEAYEQFKTEVSNRGVILPDWFVL